MVTFMYIFKSKFVKMKATLMQIFLFYDLSNLKYIINPMPFLCSVVANGSNF